MGFFTWITSIFKYFFYGRITPLIFIYLINFKKKIRMKNYNIINKNYNKNNNCKITDNIIMGIFIFPIDN